MWKLEGNNYENLGVFFFFILSNELQSVLVLTELQEVENPEKSNANG